MTLLAELARTSARVAGTPSRLAKVAELARCLRELDAAELGIAIPFLSGELRQGKLALGYGLVEQATASNATLSLAQIDAQGGR